MDAALRALILKIIAEQLGVSEDYLEKKQDSTLGELGFDSLDCVEIVMQIEDESGLELEEDKLRAGDEVTLAQFIEDLANQLTAKGWKP
jgi:acyl carrier protein